SRGRRVYRLRLGARPPWLELRVRTNDFQPVELLLHGRSVIGRSRIALRPPPAVPRMRHVLVVVFENKERSDVVDNASAPTFAALARRYASIDRYDAVAH